MSNRELFERWRAAVQKFFDMSAIYRGYHRFKDYTAENFVKKCGLTPAEAERALKMVREIDEFYSEPQDYLRDAWAEDARQTARELHDAK